MPSRLLRTDPDFAALFMRLALGLVMFPHGAQKVLGLFGGHGASATIQGFSKMGLPSWLTVLAMVEDGNEGTFGPPPATGNFVRLASAASVGQITYKPSAQTLGAWSASDADVRSIVEKDGLGTHLLWKGSSAALSAHPLSSCRIGDDPATSACDDRHELRGHPGLFVTDGAAVPTSLTVNPSVTIAALAERASRFVVQRAGQFGIAIKHASAPPPGQQLLPATT